MKFWKEGTFKTTYYVLCQNSLLENELGTQTEFGVQGLVFDLQPSPPYNTLIKKRPNGSPMEVDDQVTTDPMEIDRVEPMEVDDRVTTIYDIYAN
jgi:hypothetical protein